MPACAHEGDAPSAATLGVARAAVLCLLNRERSATGLGSLSENSVLDAAAVVHSADMVARHYFEHTTPDGLDLVTRILATGYVNIAERWQLGENIAWGTGPYATPSSAVRRWMTSPEHRANILTPGFREIGIGIAPGSPDPSPLPGATYTTDFGAHS